MRIPGESIDFDLRSPGFLLRHATGEELEDWPTVAKRASMSFVELNKGASKDKIAAVDKLSRYDPKAWKEDHFALMLERPVFIRFSACFLGAVALLSFPFIVWYSRPKRFLLNSVGYFLALWAVRQALAVGAPKTPTVIDYSVMALYLTFVAAIVAKLLWGFGHSRSAS